MHSSVEISEGKTLQDIYIHRDRTMKSWKFVRQKIK